ncbi:MAG: glycosyltransferase family 1 protein [Spartobacteria bacterium]|nr:glycosyltransferase family 1 protein [Spartobacteria bacterium]
MSDHPKITVLHLCEHFGGAKASLHGVARTFQWWIPRFDASRFRILLCSRKGPDKAAEEMTRSGITPLYLGYGKMDPRNLFKLIRLVRDEQVDIIHAHGYGACMWARIAGMLLRKPVIVHGRCNYGTVPLYQRPVEWLLGPWTRHGFAVSESTRQFCIKKRYIPETAIEVLYNGIPLENITPASSAFLTDFRAEMGAPVPDIVIGIVGRLEAHKGHLDAFQALQTVLKHYPNTRLWVVGDGAFEDELSTWVREQRLEDHIRFTGFRGDVLQVIQCFDIQLFPSHQEGTPNTLFEAMAVGNPVIASTADGQGEILEDRKTALLFAPGDTAAMAEHIRYLIEHPEERERLGSAGKEKVQTFDGRKCVERMQEKYIEICAR